MKIVDKFCKPSWNISNWIQNLSDILYTERRLEKWNSILKNWQNKNTGSAKSESMYIGNYSTENSFKKVRVPGAMIWKIFKKQLRGATVPVKKIYI